MKKLKKDTTIVIVNDFDYVQGGASKVALDTAKILHENGYNVIFFSAVHKNSEYSKVGFKIISLSIDECLKDKNKFRGIGRGLYNLKVKKEFKKLLKTLNPNTTIIHVHGWTKALSSSVFDVAFKMNFKVVLTLHDYFVACPNGGFFNYPKNKICKLVPLSCKCLCSNCDSRNYFFKLYRILRQIIQNKIVGLPSKIRYAISISEINESILKQYLNDKVVLKRIYNPFNTRKVKIEFNAKKDCFLFIGRLNKEKGADIFCQAISKANKKGVVIGSGPELKNLKIKYPNILFTGWLNSEQIVKYYERALAVIISSRLYEGASLIPMESAMYEVPCITSITCAAKEFVPQKNIYRDFDDLVHKLVNDDFEHKPIKFQNNYVYDLLYFYGEM